MPNGDDRYEGLAALDALKTWRAGKSTGSHTRTGRPMAHAPHEYRASPEVRSRMDNPIIRALVSQYPGELLPEGRAQTAFDVLTTLLGAGGLFVIGKKILARAALKEAIRTGATLRKPGRSIFPGPKAKGLLGPGRNPNVAPAIEDAVRGINYQGGSHRLEDIVDSYYARQQRIDRDLRAVGDGTAGESLMGLYEDEGIAGILGTYEAPYEAMMLAEHVGTKADKATLRTINKLQGIDDDYFVSLGREGRLLTSAEGDMLEEAYTRMKARERGLVEAAEQRIKEIRRQR